MQKVREMQVYQIYIDSKNPKKYFNLPINLAILIPLIKMALNHSTIEAIEHKFRFYGVSTIDTWKVYLSYIKNKETVLKISNQQFSDLTNLVDQLADFEFYSEENIQRNFPSIDSISDDVFTTMSPTALEYYAKLYLDNVFTKEYHRQHCDNIYQVTLWKQSQKWKNMTLEPLYREIKHFSTKLCNEFSIQDADSFVLKWKKSLAFFDEYEICPPLETIIEYLETLSSDELVTVHNAVFRFYMFPTIPTCKCSQWEGAKMDRWRNFFFIKPKLAEYLWNYGIDRKVLLSIGCIFPGNKKYNSMFKKSYQEVLNMIH